jgi:hypothetical protein
MPLHKTMLPSWAGVVFAIEMQQRMEDVNSPIVIVESA